MLGTSLPELATTAAAAWKRQSDIALGNILGSNIFNVLFVPGTAALLRLFPCSSIAVARKIQKTVPGAVKTFQPFIRYHTFADSNINFTVILRVETFVDKYLVIHEFIKALKRSYDQEGIEISFPVRKVYAVKR